jgi:hypothetical protein
MDTALRPLSTSQVLDRTFSLYRSNFALFAGIAMITPALTLVARLIQLGIFGSPFLGQGRFTPQAAQAMITRTLIGFAIWLVVYIVGTALASGATVYAVSMVHLGKPATILDSYARIKPFLRRILGLIISVFFIAAWPFLAGYVLLLAVAMGAATIGKSGGIGVTIFVIVAGIAGIVGFVGGIFWWLRAYCRYALSVAACALEQLPVRYSLVRSKFLTKGSLGRVFLIYLLTIVMGYVLTYVLQSPALFASKAVILTARSHVSVPALLWIYIAEFLGGTLAGPIAAIAMALLYYDERIRKEAFDLQLMMQTITPQTVSEAVPASSSL